MGTMNFQLPADLSTDLARELERACVIGGPDNMPWPTRVRVNSNRLSVQRDVDESGCLLTPWTVKDIGQLMTASATLMERELPYQLQIELTRGKINQLRCQAADWRTGGLQMTPEFAKRIQDASVAFGRSATMGGTPEALAQAQEALSIGYRVSEELVRLYVEQVFAVRHQRQPKLDSVLAFRMGDTVPSGAADQIAEACNGIYLPLPWRRIEPSEADYAWGNQDAILDWAEAKNLPVVAGPLIDFAPNGLPSWLSGWEKDLHSIASFMCDYVETVVQRYHKRIRSWQLTAASNCAAVLSLSEDELLWLTVRLAEAARQIDSGLEIIIGIAQPWGDYMAGEDHNHSPFIFADTLIRAGLNLAAVDLEWTMGISPTGSYCRDLLEASRVLDLYALLGVPLQVTMGYPSAKTKDPSADSALEVDGGFWHTGFTPEVQADWAGSFGALALCKPYVRGISWVHLSDDEPHTNPHCGVIDAKGAAKPALERLRELRQTHLK